MNNKQFRELKEMVLNNYSAEELLSLCGVNDYNSRTHRFSSPYDSGTNDTRLILYPDKSMYKDWIDGKNHDLITLYAKSHGISYATALTQLADYKNLGTKKWLYKKTQESQVNEIYSYNNTLFNPKYKPVIEYLKSRGYSQELIKSKLIGFREWDYRIIYPFFYKGEAVYLQARQLPEEVFNKVFPNLDYQRTYSGNFIASNGKNYNNAGKYKKLNQKQYPGINKDIPYNYDYIDFHKDREIYICEGIVDSDTLLFENINNVCIGSTTGINTEGWNTYIIPTLKSFKNIILLGDNDEAGRDATVKWALRLLQNQIYNFDFEVIPRTVLETDPVITYKAHFISDSEVKEKYGEEQRIKDINEYFIKNNYSLTGLNNTRISGFVYLAKYYKFKDPRNGIYQYIEEVIDPSYRNLPKYKINSIVKDIEAREIFNDAEIEILKNKIREAPLESQIVKEVLNNHTLIYNSSIGFYEYDGKIWQYKDDGVINTYISDCLGNRFNTGNRIQSTLTVLISNKNVYDQDIKFNQRDIVVLNNGTLYLNKDKINFEENQFNKNDFMTFKSNFDYDVNAKCPKWIEFLKDALDVRNADGSINHLERDKKIAMLQEFTGYILFSDCYLHKALILTGEGGNGKSVFNDTIEKLFDCQAVSKVPADEFKDTFKRYDLKNSILNISDETKSSLYGNESVLKEVIVGGELIGSKKFKDNAKFRVRSKLIITANNALNVNDKSNALPRRFMFVDFNWDYTDDEKELNNPRSIKKRANPNLEKELEEEIPGIFNWALEGYKKLKKNNKFTESLENKRNYENFKLSNNPIREFLADFVLGYCSLQNIDGENQYYLTTDFDSIFSSYKVFCQINGRNTVGNQQFGRDLSKQCKDLNINLERKTISNHGIRIKNYTMIFPQEVYENLEYILEAL